MSAWLAYTALAAPAQLICAGLAATAWVLAQARTSAAVCAALSAAAFVSAAICAVGIFALGKFEGSVVGVPLYIDRLSAVMLTLVAFIGAVVIRYSGNYLDGDPGQRRFLKWLCWTVAAVSILVIAGHFAVFVLAWIVTSLCLHRLLLFYPERPGAQVAARKKFLVSRLGDIALILAGVCLYRAFGTLEFGALFAAELGAGHETALTAAAFALIVGAAMKSAQFPFHSWLPEVMETPTPVSALMHAGIINAGGFLVIRMSHILVQAPAALHMLAVIGTFTALFGSLAMLTQTSVKKSLAFSTVGQMGFMMLQCGLGAFSSALLHIVAHALYKAHAFLSSGSVVDIARAAWAPPLRDNRHPGELLLAFLAALALTAGAAGLFGLHPAEEPGIVLLGAILQMALTYLLWNALAHHAGPGQILRAVSIAAGTSLLYFALQAGFLGLLRGEVAGPMPVDSLFDGLLLSVVLAGFFSILMLQIQYPGPAAPRIWQAAYVHLYNGFYISTIANRVLDRCWPKSHRFDHRQPGGMPQ
ncbi:NADH dehydrogenase [Methylomonas koyamae]|uniref:Probable inorganic carbon transporter subunit DabB n=1 Tax=Methylomonas koyamae TaxID=702114 RepID=A0A177NNW5_9GAMM|nr:proton-conducting transporter membrane subunit [Methylomonas koyamae]OAI19033.1 NADH dehydrogenase [Methylomonas koyamae]